MAITEVRQLTCDLCGYSELINDTHNTVARINAQKKGWKFMNYTNLVTKARNGRGRPLNAKQIDACATCELPTPDELVKILDARAEEA